MKHLKYFENTNEDIPLKKYCIWRNPNDLFEILQLVNSKKIERRGIEYIEYMSVLLYDYCPSTNQLIKRKDQDQIPFESNIIKTYVPYTSDNIQDCINMLPIINNKEKFNL